jgi:hypothetical protein
MNHRMSAITTPSKSTIARLSWAYPVVCLLWLGMVGLSIAASSSVNTNRIKLSADQVRLLDVSVALPGLLIWLTILFAGLSIRRYVHNIAEAKESAGFRYITYGIFALLAGLIINSYVGGLQQLFSQHAADPQRVKATFVVINNYVSVIAALVTYGLLLQSSRLLLKSLGRQLDLGRKLIPIVGAFIALTAVYLWLIHANPVRQVSANSSFNTTFGLPYWLIVLTVALPCVIAWFIGVIALIGLYQYHEKTPGIVYKLLFKKLVLGMTLFIGLTILLQLLVQLYTLYANSTLPALLGLIAIVYLILVYAFVLIAQGAKKLNTIETLLLE